MRDYGITSSKFWIGETGKRLRGNPNLQVLAHYLISSPHAAMSGLYYLPKMYIAQDTGLPLQVVMEGLRSLSEEGFCTYDEATEIVFVHKMSRYQMGDALKFTDNKRTGLIREISKLPKTVLINMFFKEYGKAYNISEDDIKPYLTSPLEAPYIPPSKPLRIQDQDQEHSQDHDQVEGKCAEVSGREERDPTGPLSLGFEEPDRKPEQDDAHQIPPDASPRLLAIVEAMQRVEFDVPGKGPETIWKNAKRPGQLAAKLEKTCPAVDIPALIEKLAGWTVANPSRAKRDLGKFLWNAATREQDNPRPASHFQQQWRGGRNEVEQPPRKIVDLTEVVAKMADRLGRE